MRFLFSLPGLALVLCVAVLLYYFFVRRPRIDGSDE